MRYKVIIYDDMGNIRKFFKANGVKKFATILDENDHGVYGRELVGFHVIFKTSDKKLIELAQRRFDLVDFIPDYHRRLYRRYNPSFRRHRYIPFTPAPDEPHLPF